MTDRAGGAVHVPVLLTEVVESLRGSAGGSFLDCTFGGGGHSRALLEAHPEASVVGIDRDIRALQRAEQWREQYGERLSLHHGTFSDATRLVDNRRFDGIVADLGMSTDQLREGRGFSFADESNLDMRMNESEGQTARDFLNTASSRELYLALVEGGVTKGAKSLVAAIERGRPIGTAREFAELVRNSVAAKRGDGGVHPATVVFQAIRMAINNERGEITGLLAVVPHLIAPRGRFACITFHSIEDKMVTNTLRQWGSGGSYPASWRGPRDAPQYGRLISKKAIVPTECELARNPASRSARLRVFEFDNVQR